MSAEEDAYFADGLTEELIARLTRIQNLKVASRTDVGVYRSQPTSIQRISKDLNVDYIVDGSVRKTVDQIRVTAQLIKTSDGFNLWAETFDREFKDIFAVQDEVAMRIASQLDMEISKKDRAAIVESPTENLEAFDIVLKSESFLLTVSSETPAEEFQQMISMLEQAVELDPNYSDAHAALAGIYVLNVFYLSRSDTLEYIRLLEKASLEAEEALALDPQNELALVTQPFIVFQRFEKKLEKKEFHPMLLRRTMLYIRKLRKLYPESPTTHLAESVYYDMRGSTLLGSEDDFETSLAKMQKALTSAERMIEAGQDDPMSIFIAKLAYHDLVSHAYDRRNFDKALKYFERGFEIASKLDNTSIETWDFCWYVAWGYRRLGYRSNALKYFEQCLRVAQNGKHRWREGRSLLGLGSAYATEGEYDRALLQINKSLEIFRELEKKSNEAVALHVKGEILFQKGNYSGSSGSFESASKMWVDLDDQDQNLWTHSWWALSKLKSGNLGSAESMALQVKTMMETTRPHKDDVIVVNWNLSQVYSGLGQNDKATKYLRVAYDEVMKQSDKIESNEFRQSFLTSVRENSEVLEAWEKLER